MRLKRLSKRLETVAKYIAEYGGDTIRLADIGSDHALLPVYLILEGKIESAVAGEVVEGPYKAAVKEVTSQKMTNQIDVRLGNGLEVIQPDDCINVISICGMGGGLIKTILQEGQEKLNNQQTLVLQPNIGESTLRQWLNIQGYTIIHETVLSDQDRFYDIIVAKIKAIQPNYSEKELFLGPVNIQYPSKAFIEKWRAELENQEKILKQVEKATQPNQDKINQFKKQIKMIKEVLDHDNI